MRIVGKLKNWLRAETSEVRKGVAQVEAAFFAWAAEIAEQYDLYEDGGDDGADDGYVPKRYSLSREGETSKGALWCACDWYWGSVYIIESGNAAEVVVAKSKDESTLIVNPALEDLDLNALGNDTLAEIVKWANGDVPKVEGYQVLKADASQQYTLGVAYPVDSVDAHGDFTDSTELEAAAWDFMRSIVAKGDPGVGTDHADGTDGAAQVVESYIYRGPQWVDEESGEVIAKEGDWLVGAVWTAEGWARVQKGELVGWSIQGTAVVDPEAEAPADGD